MRPHDRCGHAGDRWFQEFLTKMAYHPPKFPTERQTKQLLELAERIASPTQIRKRSPRRGCPLILSDIRSMMFVLSCTRSACAHVSGNGLVCRHRGAGREYERKPAALPVSAERGAGG